MSKRSIFFYQIDMYLIFQSIHYTHFFSLLTTYFCSRYQQLLAKFTARKLPEFYKKYHRESTSNKSATEDVLQEDGELFPRPLPMEKLLDIPAQIRKRRFFEVVNIAAVECILLW